MRALDAFVADTYGPQRAVAEGVVPARLIETSEGYEPAMRGVRPPGGTWVGIAGLDLVRDAGGELLVLEDNLRTPSGFAYAAEARRRAARAPRRPARARAALARRAAASCSRPRCARPRRADAEDPYAVVLTDGPDNSAAFEHAWAAEQLGAPLVEPGDLELRGDVLRHDGRAVDVVYRRTDADTVETEVGRLLVPPMRAGTLGLVNAFGTGVADDKLAHAYVEDLVRFHLGEEPLLRSVDDLDLCRAGAPRARARRARRRSSSSRGRATAASASSSARTPSATTSSACAASCARARRSSSRSRASRSPCIRR